MAKIDRLERLDLRRIDLELEYRGALIAALERTAAGKPGLFHRTPDKRHREEVAPTVALLRELGEAIDDLRDRLMLPPFALHREFLDSRGPVAPSAAGEPKQAKAWLGRLAAEER